MLTASLVRASVKKGELLPGFVDFSTERVAERATEILSTVQQGVGSRRGEIEEELESLLGDATDRKLFDGFAKVVFDCCEFATEAAVEPRELRRRVWLASARAGPLSAVAIEGIPTRDDVLVGVGAEVGLGAHDVAELMYADHPDEQRLVRCDLVGAEALVERYNLGLVQALLFSAASVEVCLTAPEPARVRQVLRAVKFNQLCFAARRDGADYRLVIDGPASLFSATSRYGLALARFLGTLALAPGPWSLSAEVAWHRARPRLTVTDRTGLRSHYRDVGAYETREAAWFLERFEALESGWSVERDPLPLVQGADGVVVPDFAFRKDGRLAYLEILGFWRKGSVAARLASTAKHGPGNLVLAVSKRYATDEAGEVPEGVVPFAEVVPAREVLRLVEERAVRERAAGRR